MLNFLAEIGGMERILGLFVALIMKGYAESLFFADVFHKIFRIDIMKKGETEFELNDFSNPPSPSNAAGPDRSTGSALPRPRF